MKYAPFLWHFTSLTSILKPLFQPQCPAPAWHPASTGSHFSKRLQTAPLSPSWPSCPFSLKFCPARPLLLGRDPIILRCCLLRAALPDLPSRALQHALLLYGTVIKDPSSGVRESWLLVLALSFLAFVILLRPLKKFRNRNMEIILIR